MLVERVEAAASRTTAARACGPTRALSILCAEDNPYGRVVMNTILAELGHRVDFVEHRRGGGGGGRARRLRRGADGRCAGGLDGIEATRRIRALPGEAGQVPVIGISGRGDAPATRRAARAAGMNDYLSKPVSPRLAQALARHRVT